MKTISGRHFVSFRTNYENIMVTDDKGNNYYLSPEELTYLLYEHWFHVVKKRTRTWITTKKTYEHESNTD